MSIEGAPNPREEEYMNDDYQQEIYHEYVDMVENVLGERLPKARYSNLGTFRAIMSGNLRPRHAANFNSLWRGKISVDNREDINRGQIDIALAPDNLSRYYIITSYKACPRCIDGRCILQFDERSEESFENMRGPQAPGGSVTVAICDRVASWKQEFAYIEEFTLADDIVRIEKIYDEAGMKLGAHGDDHAPEGMTGCGAIDKVPEILRTITSADAQPQVRLLAKAMLGDDYDSTRVDAILGRFLSLQSASDEYFMENEDGSYEYRQKAVDAVKNSNPDNVEILKGPHREVALIVNKVKNTTFHRDQFAVDNDDTIHLFNYDLWWSYEIAEKLHPIDGTMDEVTKEKNEELRARFITARVLFAIGTCMELTDGSIDVIVRDSASAAEAA